MDKALADRRVKAAEAAKGISSHPIYMAVIKQIRNRALSGSVLDFGAGTGGFTELLHESGQFSKIDAADIIDYRAVKDSNARWIVSDLNLPLPVQADSYDLVVSVEVIEHLENPRFVAREWFRILRPGGQLLFSTPNNESWRSIVSFLVRGHFAAFTGLSYPAHITALLRTDMCRVLEEAGFTDTQFSFSDSGGIPGKPVFTWQQISFGLLRGLRHSDNTICFARKPAA